MKYLLFYVTLILGGFLNQACAQDVESYMKKANEARDHEDFEEAAKFYTKVIELDPNNVDALYYRGWVESLWDKSKGIEDFRKVLELDSLHEGALHAVAEYYSIRGEYKLAEEYEMKAISLNPKSSSNLLKLARKSNAAGEYEKAVEYCNESISLEEDTIQLWLTLLERGEAYLGLEKYTESIRDFEKCFNDYSFGMYSCNNYEMCGDAYNGIGNTNKACEYWRIAVRNDDPEFDPASDSVKNKVKTSCRK